MIFILLAKIINPAYFIRLYTLNKHNHLNYIQNINFKSGMSYRRHKQNTIFIIFKENK
jgi:hypothetical protein